MLTKIEDDLIENDDIVLYADFFLVLNRQKPLCTTVHGHLAMVLGKAGPVAKSHYLPVLKCHLSYVQRAAIIFSLEPAMYTVLWIEKYIQTSQSPSRSRPCKDR
jgi:hypothetical protein